MLEGEKAVRRNHAFEAMRLRSTDHRQHPSASRQALEHDVDWMIGMYVYKRIAEKRDDRISGFPGFIPLFELPAGDGSFEPVTRADEIRGRIVLPRPLPGVLDRQVW